MAEEEQDGGVRTADRSMGSDPRMLVQRAREQLAAVMGRRADAVSGFAREEDGWRVTVEVVELERIPPSDDLYSKDLNGTAITTVRCRTPSGTNSGGELRDITPELEGIKLDNRWVVIYSKYDIGCALERHQSTDCLGHDPASALKLGSAVVLYALKR